MEDTKENIKSPIVEVSALQRADDDILKCAAKLFAEKSYNSVELEDIAQEAGVSEAVLKKMYKSKPKLREALYNRYRKIHQASAPSFDDVFRTAKTAHPLETLLLLDYKLPKNEGEFLTHTFLGALQDFHYNKASGELIKINSVDNVIGNAKQILDYLVFLKKIESLDADGITRVIALYVFASTIFDKMMEGASPEEYGSGLQMILSLVKVKEE